MVWGVLAKREEREMSVAKYADGCVVQVVSGMFGLGEHEKRSRITLEHVVWGPKFANVGVGGAGVKVSIRMSM